MGNGKTDGPPTGVAKTDDKPAGVAKNDDPPVDTTQPGDMLIKSAQRGSTLVNVPSIIEVIKVFFSGIINQLKEDIKGLKEKVETLEKKVETLEQKVETLEGFIKKAQPVLDATNLHLVSLFGEDSKGGEALTTLFEGFNEDSTDAK
ncbi:unnamed protein product [Parascedosporium putredinis]|uniref:Uncharacterized protein n=1 Tax=Parascedosporium putredinis TaxID=1442378 RepID=A0A9P1HBB6_9PEZI|nr:unnamed protein product [Parascedosporium putredinis]CAI8002557.1 unnamed protein product [Parascedosporium putredinis]